MRNITILIFLALTGCVTANPPAPAPQVTVTGPTFTPGQFACGPRPIPPNPDKQGTGKAGALHENKLGGWGEACSAKLESIGAALAGAGQVAGD
jgi:protein involved in polysaccharide export with SLBB domain